MTADAAQLALIPKPPNEARLTDRQARVLELVRTTPGGIAAREAGATLHAIRHNAGGRECSCCIDGEPCAWADHSGREVLTRLRQLGYGLIRRKTGRWVIPKVTPPADNGIAGPGALPEDF